MQAKNNQASQPKTDTSKPATSVGKVIAAKKKQNTKTQKDWVNCPKCNKAYKIQASLDKHVASCNGEHKGGMPKGYMTPEKVALKEQKLAMQHMIAKRASELITHQFTMAMGVRRLMVRHKVVTEIPQPPTKTGKERKPKTIEKYEVRVASTEADFALYLSLPHDEYGNAKDEATGDEYYYFTLSEGNNQALTNLLDRAFGKPKENVELGEDPDQPLPQHGTGTTTELRKLFLDLAKQTIRNKSDDENTSA